MATSSKTQAPHKYRVVGTRPIRPDGIEKVTGRALYGADYYFPGMLFGKVLRSPYPHARIKSIKFDKALKLDGVRAVVTADDLPDADRKPQQMGEQQVSPYHLSCNVLARGKVLYDGHPIAALAATSPHIAEEALKLIEVEYEQLEPAMTVEQAMKPDAPILLDDLRNQEQGPDQPTNIAAHLQFKRGDLEAGFAAADHIVEREFHTATVHQGYIEPHASVGIWNPDGHATVYTCTQGSFTVRTLTTKVLGMPEGNLKVVPSEIGGGFGGKTTIYCEPLALLLAKKTGHPVKVVMSRAEVLRATGPTSGIKERVKLGITNEGRITAAQVWMAYEAGAFPGSPMAPGAMTVITSYDIPNLLIDGYDVVVNRPKTCAYRAPGATAAAFGVETILDELAEKIGIDPLDLRIMNGSHEGVAQPFGPVFKRIGFIETCEAMKKSEHYQSKLTGAYRGRGVAAGFWFNAGFQSTASIYVSQDGTANVVTGSVDVGGSRASMAMIAAEVLGLGMGEVRPMVADTDSIGYTDVTAGSRVTFATGMAVYNAAQDVVRQLKERAAKLWECTADDVEFDNGVLRTRGDVLQPQQLTLKELAARFVRTGGPVVGRASVSTGGAGAGPAFAVACIDVEVDPDTGKVQILRATVAQDVGTAIHPSYVEGQLQGGLAQGIGWALNEEYVYDSKGILRNTGLLDYRMPTCLDLPKLETILVEVPNPIHPFGVRGVGEVSIVPPPAAVANAIYRATGVRMQVLPMSPPRVLKALLQHRNGQEGQAAAGR